MHIQSASHSDTGGQSPSGEQNLQTNKACQSGLRWVTAVVIGAGPVGLACVSQLYSGELVHDKFRCQKQCHYAIADGQSIHVGRVPDAVELSTKGKTPCGNWVDSFCFRQDNTPETCLTWQVNPARRIDTLLVASSPLGGGWSLYHPEQYTVSPYQWMGFPEFPIGHWVAGRDGALLPGGNSDRSKISACSLCDYFSDYAARKGFLPAEQRLLNHRVHKISQMANGEWKVEYYGNSQSSAVQSRYVFVACGKTLPRKLKIPGEDDFPHVVHSTCEARKALEKLAPGGRVLLIGKGMSAADVIERVRLGGHKLTHLIPTKDYPDDPVSSRHVLEKLKNRRDEYPVQAQAYRWTHQLESAPDFYEQRKDWRLIAVDGDGCVLAPVGGGTKKEHYDLVCIVIGSEPDIPVVEINGQAVAQPVSNLNRHTMESDYRNLFFIGMCTGEPFQRFSIGHAVAAAETAKSREFSDD